MKRLTILVLIAVVLIQTNQINAESLVFDTDTVINTKEVITNDETWSIEGNIILNNVTINYGIIKIEGSLYNTHIIKNYGIIINNGTMTNTMYIINYGTIINNGVFNNTFVVNNANLINNTGIINNRGYVYNFGTINNIEGTTNSELLALFPGIVTGMINNEGGILEPTDFSNPIVISSNNVCDLTLSKTVINEGESITAFVDTNAGSVEFTWIDPLGQTQRNIIDSNAPFNDTYTPTMLGEWIIDVTCSNGGNDSQLFSMSFNVLPESPIGTIVISTTSIGVLVAYLHRRIH